MNPRRRRFSRGPATGITPLLRGLMLVVLLLPLLLLVTSMQAPPTGDVSGFMKQKLEHAHGVLNGIVLEDYGMISKHANRLQLLSNESTWTVLHTLEYGKMSQQFRDSVSQLTKEAKKKNIDGATLAYFQMTLNCVNCHKHVRDERGG